MVNDDFDTLKLTLHSKQFSTQRINPMNLNAANIESEFFRVEEFGISYFIFLCNFLEMNIFRSFCLDLTFRVNEFRFVKGPKIVDRRFVPLRGLGFFVDSGLVQSFALFLRLGF